MLPLSRRFSEAIVHVIGGLACTHDAVVLLLGGFVTSLRRTAGVVAAEAALLLPCWRGRGKLQVVHED